MERSTALSLRCLRATQGAVLAATAAIAVAISPLGSAQAIAQSPYQCHEMFEKGRSLDSRLNSSARTWLRAQESFFERLKQAVLDTRRLVDGDETPKAFDTVRAHMEVLLSMMDGIDSQSNEVEEAVDRVANILSNYESDCGIPPSIEDWFEKKQEVIDQIKEQVPKSKASFSDIRQQFQGYRDAPSKLLRRIDLLKLALDKAIAESPKP